MSLKIGKYTTDTIVANAPSTWMIGETLDEGYVEVTSVTKWLRGVGPSFYDYSYCRDQATDWITTQGGFSGLTNEDQLLSAKHFLVSKTDRNTVMSEDDQYKAWGSFVSLSRNIRQRRWDLAKKYVSYHLEPLESVDISLETQSLSNEFVEYKIPYLIHWMEGSNSYVGGGFPSKDYWTQEMQDYVVGVLTNGERLR